MSYKILFLQALSPGKVFRYFERNHSHSLPVRSLLLSDGVGDSSTRCLFTDETSSVTDLPVDWMEAIAPELSSVFPPRTTMLWRQAPGSTKPGKWGRAVWESGSIVETVEQLLAPDSKPGLLSRLPGMKRNAPPPLDIAWALAQGLPIDRVPTAGLRRHIPIIDYVTVAQLDQRSLLVENSPRLYRFTFY